MRIPVGQRIERSGAMWALVRLLVAVDIHVLLQFGLDRKSFVADLAVEGLLVVWGVDVDDVVSQGPGSSGSRKF